MYLSNPYTRAGCDTRSSLNWEVFFYQICSLTKARERSLFYYLPIAGDRKDGFISSFKIWTQIIDSIFYNDNHYARYASTRAIDFMKDIVELLGDGNKM